MPGGLRAEGLLCLASKPVLLLAVAGREVERDKLGNACSPCDITSLTRRKMSPLCGNVRICVEECRLNKKLVGTVRERDDADNVLLMIGGVHHVSDLLTRRHAQRVLLEHAERDRQVAADDNLAVVGRAPPTGVGAYVRF